MAALAHDLGGSLGALAMRAAEVFAFRGNATTGRVLAFLRVAHRTVTSFELFAYGSTRVHGVGCEARMRGWLEGAHSFFGYELVDAYVHGLGESAEAFQELFGPVGLVAAPQQVVPDVLRLPQIQVEWHL